MIGIVILNYMNWDDTIECVQSIQKFEYSELYHIYIVDNNSPNTIDYDLKFLINNSKVTLIWNKENKGYSAGNNIGIKMAKEHNCDAILISNSDVRFEENSIELMYQYLNKHTNVGIVGPKIILKDGSAQRNNLLKKTTLKEKYLIRTKLNTIFRKLSIQYFGTERSYDYECTVYAVSGCCFMISKNCINKIEYLDENTFLYDEELILGLMMERYTIKTVYYPAAIVRHLHGQSTKYTKPFAFACMISSEIYYCINYLNAKKLAIMPLYIYRSLCYLGRCVIYSEFRTYFGKYIKITQDAFCGRGVNGDLWKLL